MPRGITRVGDMCFVIEPDGGGFFAVIDQLHVAEKEVTVSWGDCSRRVQPPGLIGVPRYKTPCEAGVLIGKHFPSIEASYEAIKPFIGGGA